MSKYTPGPWSYSGYRVFKSVVLSSDPLHQSPIAEIAQGNAKSLANLRLIVAAPNLLAALEDVIADLEHYVSTHGPGPDRRLEAARAAIAKAKGE